MQISKSEPKKFSRLRTFKIFSATKVFFFFEIFLNFYVNTELYRTSGVIFFIDYCTAIRDT